MARVHVRAWQIGYRHLLPDSYLAQLRPEERAGRYDFATGDTQRPLTLVAESDGAIRGFATTAPARDGDLPGHGELCALYVAPTTGTTALVHIDRSRPATTDRTGIPACRAVAAAGNDRAERFYYRTGGWTPDGTARQDHIWSITVDEVRCRRPLLA